MALPGRAGTSLSACLSDRSSLPAERPRGTDGRGYLFLPFLSAGCSAAIWSLVLSQTSSLSQSVGCHRAQESRVFPPQLDPPTPTSCVNPGQQGAGPSWSNAPPPRRGLPAGDAASREGPARLSLAVSLDAWAPSSGSDSRSDGCGPLVRESSGDTGHTLLLGAPPSLGSLCLAGPAPPNQASGSTSAV